MRTVVILCFLLALGSLSSVNGFRFSLKPRDILRKIKLDGVLGNGVKQMEVDVKETVSSFDSIIFGPKSEPKQDLDSKTTLPKALGSFSIQSCGPKDQPIDVKRLSILPDPLYFPGQIKIAFDVEFAKTIGNGPDLEAMVHLDVKTSGQWINIPCLGTIGSCHYKDLCGMLKQIEECPSEFEAAGIPCKCPFMKGDYKLPEIVAEIDASVFLPGDYRGNITLTDKKGRSALGCYKLTFTIG